MKNVRGVYPGALTVHKRQRCINKIKNVDCKLSDKPPTGRATLLDYDLLKASLKADSYKSDRDLVK